jgi:hypothetical protein
MDMIKIVINRRHGGFGLSHEAMMRYAELKGIHLVLEEKYNMIHYYKDEIKQENYFYDRDIDRADPALVQVVEEFGERADGRYSELKVVEVPEEVNWYIEEYDGLEWVAERHRTWN